MSGQETLGPPVISQEVWDQVGSTIRMLHLAVAQIDMAMYEGEDSVKVLSDSFTHIMEGVREMSAMVAELGLDENAPLRSRGEEISGQMYKAVVAFQFYDKLAQRLHHVMLGLNSLAGLIGEPERSQQTTEWSELQQRIRSTYTMKEEQFMFDAILNGASIAEALDIYKSAIADAQDDDDIELF